VVTPLSTRLGGSVSTRPDEAVESIYGTATAL